MEKKKPELKISEDGKKITVIGPLSRVSHTFEIVDRVPPGYHIWNIGDNMADGYLPLCRLCAIQPFPGGRSIEADTLKAIKCEGAQLILDAIWWGAERAEEMERFIEKNKDKPNRRRVVERMKKAMPYIRKIEWM